MRPTAAGRHATAPPPNTSGRRGNAVTRATAFVSRYRLNLFSNFTYFLDDPERGDQFEQADRRWMAGGRVSQTRRMRWGSRLGENTLRRAGPQRSHSAGRALSHAGP